MLASVLPQVVDSFNINRRFLKILPQIQACAQYAFRNSSVSLQEEAVQDILVQSFVAFRRLCDEGSFKKIYPTVLARFAILRYRSGRQAVSTEPPQARIFRDPAPLLSGRPRSPFSPGHDWKEVLIEDRRTPIPEQVSFRIDFQSWLLHLTPMRRRCAEFLADGHTPLEVAGKLRISSARVSQIRRELREDWERFTSETAA